MLKVDHSLNHVPLGRSQVLSLHEAINLPVMSFPQGGAHPTGAYVLGACFAPGVHTVFVYLHQPGTASVILYVSEPRSLSYAQFLAEEQDAVRFVESMGFMVDNLDFERLSPSEQDAVIQRVPVFRPPVSTLDLVDVAASDEVDEAGLGYPGQAHGLPPTGPAGALHGSRADPLGAMGRVPERAVDEGWPVREGGTLDLSADGRAALVRIGRLLSTFVLAMAFMPLSTLGCQTTGAARTSVENHLSLGNQYLAQGHWADAVRAFTTVLEADRNDREGLWGLGVAYWRLERPTQAEQHLRKAIAADPKWSVPKNELAGVLIDLRRCDEAVELLRQVMDDIFYPSPEFAEHNLASAEACAGRPEDGIARLEALLVKRPRFCLGYLTLAQLSSQARKPEVVVRACEGFEKECESDAEIRKQVLPQQSAMCYFQRGLAHAELGDVESARASFMRCLASGAFETECSRSLQMLPP